MEIKTGIYQHYKGYMYLVLGVATHSESREPLVVYVPLYLRKGDKKSEWMVRPALGPEGFLEKVNKPEYKWKGPRFKFLFPVDTSALKRSK
ncbi:MAG: DUF1653 domain-containing protein [Candidatus Yanofskybacteria bacterium]|nr:DUF1653 domain-containing protein [Candidatus Yanofskybacteria bacterium]